MQMECLRSCYLLRLSRYSKCFLTERSKQKNSGVKSHIPTFLSNTLRMARPLRLEFAGALYHITSRGDRREDIYLDDEDRSCFLVLLGEVCQRFNWTVHAYCLITNHYHFLVETPDGNLSQGMRQLNDVYTQRFNRRHGPRMACVSMPV